MDEGGGTYGERVAALLQEVVAEGQRLPGQVFRLGGGELGELLGLVDRCRALMEAAAFTLTGEAETRGEVAASQAASTGQWVREHAPCLDDRGAGLVAKAVRVLAPARFAAVRAAVAAGRLSPAVGVTVATELDALAPLLADGAEEAVLAGLVAMGAAHGCRGVRDLRPALLARYGLGDRLQDEQDRRAGLTTLTTGRDIGGGITQYLLRLTPEARAVLEAAIGPLSAPAPRDGAPDARTAEQRRGQALVEVCRRATAVSPTTTPAGVKATVFVTIRAQDLHNRARPGTVFGGLDAGTLLGPETVRKLSCDAEIVPVLTHPDRTDGTDGTDDGQDTVTRLGRGRRLFSPQHTKTLWLRDRHCTFPGCHIPAHWTDAHHIHHWADGGPTTLDNAALLCGRHHTIVHRDRLTATLTPTGITWDPTPGSYDRRHHRPHSGTHDTTPADPLPSNPGPPPPDADPTDADPTDADPTDGDSDRGPATE